MNKRFLSVIFFAVLFSGAMSFLIYRVIVARVASSANSGSGKVVVAARNLDVGTLIRDSDVKVSDWSGPVPAQAAKTAEDAIGRGVIAAVLEGEPVMESRLAPKGAGAGMAATIPAGMRAVAVRVNEVVGISGFAVPGMHVDVLISGQPRNTGMNSDTQTRTILQNVAVLSAGQNFQKDAEGKPVTVQVINLLVTPEQAEVLSLASNEAKIQLILRNPLDKEQTKTPGTALASLFSGGQQPAPRPTPSVKPRPRPAPRAKPEPAAASKPEVRTVEVFHIMQKGVTRAEAKFETPLEVVR